MDIPLETGATVTLNYNAVNASGKFQASREFISKKTVDANFNFYLDSLKKSGWTITQATQDPKQSVILATKGDNNLNIRIYTDAGKVKVAISNETNP